MRNFAKVFDRTVFEKLVALSILTILSPLMLLVAIAIKVTSAGEIIFSQVRVGKNGQRFNIYKFRTMIKDAESQTGAVLSWKSDPRITGLGHFLRKMHLDELPQLFNVIKGDMGLVGPRPERPEMTKKFKKDIQNYFLRETIKPGITGMAQIVLPYNAKANEKLQYDLYHVLNQDSLKLFFIVSLFTLRKMFSSKLYTPEKTFMSSLRSVSEVYNKKTNII